LFIDDEPSKAVQNPKCNGLFVESFKGHKMSKNKVQWLDLTSHLWPALVGLLMARTIGVHYEINQIFKAPVDFFAELFLVHAIHAK
jgi:hypothetical protein